MVLALRSQVKGWQKSFMASIRAIPAACRHNIPVLLDQHKALVAFPHIGLSIKSDLRCRLIGTNVKQVGNCVRRDAVPRCAGWSVL